MVDGRTHNVTMQIAGGLAETKVFARAICGRRESQISRRRRISITSLQRLTDAQGLAVAHSKFGSSAGAPHGNETFAAHRKLPLAVPRQETKCFRPPTCIWPFLPPPAFSLPSFFPSLPPGRPAAFFSPATPSLPASRTSRRQSRVQLLVFVPGQSRPMGPRLRVVFVDRWWKGITKYWRVV